MLTPEIMSLLGQPLSGLPVSEEEQAKLEQQLTEAEQELAADPENEDRLIMYGRRQAYVGRYRDAIETFSRALARHPQHAMLYRHRGHRYITLRQFAVGERDLARAAELDDKDWDIWYHLGLARFLLRDYAGAAKAFRCCYDLTTEDELMTAILHWSYMTLRLLGEDAAARSLVASFAPERIEENVHYYNLVRFYQGQLSEEEMLELCRAGEVDYATMGFGLGVWHLCGGRRERARELFSWVVKGRYWPAFGFIGAEAFLAAE